MTFPNLKFSQVRLYGESCSACGYCGDKKDSTSETSVAYGIVSEHMTVNDYQSLMFLGWRRSGTYFYKPIMHKTCCPSYTIRLNVNNFKSSKSQKKVQKNMDNFLHRIEDTIIEHSNEPRKLEITLEESSYTLEKFQLYQKYQTSIHSDEAGELSPDKFTRFLVTSPLFDSRPPSEIAASFKYGTYHQLYRVDGLLIAVGVLDILPTGLSSVYFFYDNSYKHLALGKYSALNEIAYCQAHGFSYYYMGYYIHNCPKMNYKAEYKPSELLCPTTFTWHPLAECLELLSKHKFTPLDKALAAERDLLPVPTTTNNNNTNSSDSNSEVKEESQHITTDSPPPQTTVIDHNQLTPFLPRLPNTTVNTTSKALNQIRLDIGAGRYISLSQLRPADVENLRGLLEEWISVSGVEVNKNIVLCFN